jgi:lysophospholipase
MRLPLVLLVPTIASWAAMAQNVTAYAPIINVACPNVSVDPLLRIFSPSNQSLHPDEQEYVTSRATQILPNAWLDWIGDGSAIGYNSSAFAGQWATIGISISGGGYRAAQYGAGVLSGLDARNASSKAAGTGGLLQVTSYLSGLSGESKSSKTLCTRIS